MSIKRSSLLYSSFILLAAFMLPILMLAGASPLAAASITIDGIKEAAWGSPLAADPLGDMSESNLDMHGLYVVEDADNIYIGLDALASTWGMAYGIYLDTNNTAGSGGSSDPWGRNVSAVSDHRPEYALYVWHDGGTDTMQEAQLATWNGSGWDYPTLISLGGQQGYGPAEDWLEYRVPKSALGIASGTTATIFLEGFSTGGDKHAQDSVPSDPNVNFADPDWSDAVTELSAFAEFPGPPLLVTFPGDYAEAAGLGSNWAPDNLNTQANDDNNDGVWKFYTEAIPANSYNFKATVGGTWDENYGRNGVPGGDNLTFTATGGGVHFYYDRSDNYVASRPDFVIAAAVGSFQSEIGCPGDWQPECLRSWLKDPDGDGTYVFETTAIPADDYEAKVAHSESWDENYGAGGSPGGANIPFSVPVGARVHFSYELSSHILTITATTGGLEPGDEALVRDPVRVDAANEVFYFVLPDRFDNGDPGNDSGGDASGDPLINGFLPNDKGYYHGGDIAGLMGKLDYLDNLGITAIWMTPQFTNSWVQGNGTIAGSSAAYHGYWQIDYSQIDPHFGTDQEVKNFISAAHARGMKVFFDVVINHTGDVISYEGGVFNYRNKADYPYRDADGNIFDDRDYAGTGSFPALDPAVSFPYVPTFPDPGDSTAKNPAWLNNPIYYHNRGDTTFTGENALYGDFFGLDDLFTEHPDVVDGMIEIHKNMITEFGVDGFRVDTVQHVNDELWEQFIPAILAHAQSEGIDNFFIFGEVGGGDPAFLSRFTTQLPFPSVLDFGFDGAARAFAAAGTATDTLRDFFAGDDYFTDTDSNAYGLVKFVGNHDIGRLGYDIDSSNPGATDAERVARSNLAYALAFLSRGVPLIYYGDEQGFTGDGRDKDARQDMMPSLVPSYMDDDLIGTDATTADANFDNTHPLYQAYQAYSSLHSAHLALRQGAQLHRYSEGSAGIYAFSRIERYEQVEYVIALNNSEAADTATFTTSSPGTTFTELYPGGGPGLATDAGGSLTVSVPALDFVVYRADAPIPTSTTAPAINMTAPDAGAEVTGRVAVMADVSAEVLAEVTFAVSVDGADYEVIGTDDNAPYRVAYDVSGLPAGTSLTFKAVVDDLAGNLNADKVSVTVAVPQPPGVGVDYAILHYLRDDGDYGDHSTGDYHDFWGLHLWGDIEETIDWTAPKPFLGEDEYGRFAWVKLAPGATNLGFIVHRGDTKDGTTSDRFFNPSQTPEIWLRQDDALTYLSQAEAQGFVTIHYQRPDGDYGDPTSNDYNDFWGLHLWGGAIDPSEGTDWTAPKKPTGVDNYGAYWDILIQDTSQPVNFIIHRGDSKDPGPDQSLNPLESATVWIQSGDETIYTQRGAAEGFATLHYRRDAGDYGDYGSSDYNDYWGMHTWGGAADPGWTTPRKPADQDLFGVVFEVPLFENATEIGYILHRGDEKDPGVDQFLVFDDHGYEVWQLQAADPENPYILPVPKVGGGNAGNIAEQRAYWVEAGTIAWSAGDSAAHTYTLHYAPEGGLEATVDGITGGSFITLTPDPAGLPDVVKEKFPHLADLPALKIAAGDLALVPEILKAQIAVSVVNADGLSIDATGLQIPGVLDDLYAYDGELGVSWAGNNTAAAIRTWSAGAVPTIRLWAPTAKSVTFHLFDDADPATDSTTWPMTLDPATGVWHISGDASWKNKFYLFEVEVYIHATGQVEHNIVTDPYSFSLAMNSSRSQIVDLADTALAPAGWKTLEKPELAAPEDISIYEIHVRDFSVNDPSVPDELKGTFKAFTLEGTYGMNHLEALAEAGLTHLHLLPVFDIATINENKAEWQEPDPADLAMYAPDSEEQQAAVTATEDLDGFNWGYDPWHYTVPEGSYSTNPDGSTRILEFREMVQSLNQKGLRVVMDVVYNHTNASGQGEKSVLDRIVPGYYHRLNDKGQVETSTCCQNTASEHDMMEKLMVDSLVVWARQYKVDAFRFDLMGHHMLRNMVAVRQALDSLTLEKDGVDGKSIYIYGEGWNFGEVADNARGVNATQLNIGGLGIGTFSDRLRDAVRGGGPFDGGQDLIRRQGFANGLYTDPNALNSGSEAELNTLLLLSDQIRVGMAGNLAAYEFIDRNGNLVTGAQVDYNGQPAGYTLDPQEDITYISKHDNQTLYDNNVYKLPVGTGMADRVRVQNLGLSTVLLGQGVPFMHAGSDLLRSKSLDRDSFNSGDWFNKLDFTYQANNFGVGLPVAGKNQDNWPIMQPLLANLALMPDQGAIMQSAGMYRELLQIRYSSKLFRLETAEEIQQRVAFYNTGPGQLPGLIAMSISDMVGPDLDRERERVVVLVNANDETLSLAIPELAGLYLALHPVQQESVDPLVRMSSFNQATGTFTVPGRTAAVFIQYAPAEERIAMLIEEVQQLVDDGVLNKGQGNALIVKLEGALTKLTASQPHVAVNRLQAFINQVNAFISGGILTPEQGYHLIATAQSITEQIIASH